MEESDRTESASESERRSAVPSRREFLIGGGGAAVTALSGCLGGESSPETTTTDSTGDSPTDTAAPTDDPTSTTDQPAELTSLTYRHRYKRTGIGTGLNDAGVEMGTWEEEGLDVSFETSSGSQAAAQSVANGKDMFGNAGISSVLGMIEEGAPLVIIGQLLDPLGGVVSTGEQGITSWSDLEGKTVGQYPYGSTGVAAKAAMRQEGVDLDAITFQNVQPGNGERLMLNGDVDAMIKFVPLTRARLVKQGYSPNVLVTSHALDYLGISLYTRESVVEDNPEMVNSFVRGWLEAYQIFANQIDRVFDIYTPLAVEGFDEEVQREALGEYYAAQVPDPAVGQEYGKGWTSPDELESTIETFADNDVIEGSVSAEDAYTNEFIDDNRDLAVETATTIYDRLEDFDIGPNYY